MRDATRSIGGVVTFDITSQTVAALGRLRPVRSEDGSGRLIGNVDWGAESDHLRPLKGRGALSNVAVVALNPAALALSGTPTPNRGREFAVLALAPVAGHPPSFPPPWGGGPGGMGSPGPNRIGAF